MENCTFCKIVNNELPSYKIYEDEIVIVFLSIDPISNGHTLIVPKEHYLDINDIPLEILNYINKISKEIYNLLKDKLNFNGLQFIQNNGTLQEIKHYHLHLIPKYNDDIKLTLDEVYKKIKE